MNAGRPVPEQDLYRFACTFAVVAMVALAVTLELL